ncbi:MAG: hypothetical protein WC211_08740, partial [Dehalococcoidia bacterium]
MTTRTPRPAATEATIAYERTVEGALVAIEVVTSDHWHDAFLDPPARARADARVVVLRHAATIPHPLPGWLHVERAARLALREATPRYGEASDVTTAHRLDAHGRLAEALWAASPHRAPAVGTIEQYLQAAAIALRYPAPSPTGSAVTRLVRDHARAHAGLLAPVLDHAGPALERWFQRTFHDPDTLAAEVLLARIAVTDADTAAALRFLRAAEVPLDAPTYLDLALDRRALLEQASPWRYIEAPRAFAPALAAVRPWLRRYRVAYDAEYRHVAARAVTLRRDLGAVAVAADALRRLDVIEALGAPTGALALRDFDTVCAALDALPADPDPAQPRTAGITLGVPVPLFDAATAAVDAVRAALEVQRRRLAARATHLVLDRTEVPALDRLLQALTAADIDGL